MYILVRQEDNVIIGTATRPVDTASASENGYRVYEIDDSEFKEEMLGSKIVDYVKEQK